MSKVSLCELFGTILTVSSEMRLIFKEIRELVERRYRRNPESVDDNLPRQSVSAFIFLRFIVPAILHPHLFGLYPGMSNQNLISPLYSRYFTGLLPLPVQRSLTLIAKVMQSLANLNVVSPITDLVILRRFELLSVCSRAELHAWC